MRQVILPLGFLYFIAIHAVLMLAFELGWV